MKNSTNLQGEIKLIPIEKKKKDFFIYYDEFNGNIATITTQKLDNDTQCIIDSTGIAERIVKGELSITKYAVGYKDYTTNELTLIQKTSLVNFVKKDAELYKVPRKIEKEGIAFTYYEESQLLEVEFNAIVLGNYNDPLWKGQFKLALDEQFIIYLIDKEDPDILYARYIFPLSDIFEEESILVPNFTKFNPRTMEICTKRHFRDYSLILRNKFVETDYHKNKLGRLNMVKEFVEEENSHIDLIQHDNENLEIISHLTNTKQVSQYEKQLKFYICSGEDPDSYEQGLTFSWKDLIPKKNRLFKTEGINLNDKMILYSGKKIKVTFRGENNYAENTNN